ncbi:S49 family peptidase [Megalodesulfovibrio paquesii]
MIKAIAGVHQPGAALAPSGEEGAAQSYTVIDGVAVVAIEGVIQRKAGGFSLFGSRFSWSGQDQIRAAVTAAMDDPQVLAVLLSFNSPGGVAAGVKELADFIAAQDRKPVYAYADGLCASAAYWLAAATRKLFAPRTASVGSIGVLHVHCDRSAANAAAGLRYTYISGGAMKASGNTDAPLSGADQAYLQQMVATLHDIFRADVVTHMGVDAAAPATWGDGRVFLADDARAIGLITGIVTDREALIAHIKQEITMDKTQLAAAHPELVAEIQAEARQAADTAAQTRLQEAAEMQVALVRVVAGDAVATQVATLLHAGITPAQLAVLTPMLAAASPAAASPAVASLATQPAAGAAAPTPAPTAQTPPQAPAQTLAQAPAQTQAPAPAQTPAQAEILAAIRTATPGPVNTSATVNGGNPMQAAIDRISAL